MIYVWFAVYFPWWSHSCHLILACLFDQSQFSLLWLYSNFYLFRFPAKACQSGQFRCDNGQCIDNSRRCDHRADCERGEDEYGCQTTSREYIFSLNFCFWSFYLFFCNDKHDDFLQPKIVWAWALEHVNILHDATHLPNSDCCL